MPHRLRSVSSHQCRRQGDHIEGHAQPIPSIGDLHHLQSTPLDEFVKRLLAVRPLVFKIIEEIEGIVLIPLKAEAGREQRRIIWRLDVDDPARSQQPFDLTCQRRSISQMFDHVNKQQSVEMGIGIGEREVFQIMFDVFYETRNFCRR